VAADYPNLLSIVEAKVKPERQKLRDNSDAIRRKTLWWQWGRYTPSLFAATTHLPRVLSCSRVGNAFAFCFLAPSVVMSERLVVIAMSSYAAFATIQSRVHEFWARFNGSTLKDDLTYTPSDCFETFPFPRKWQTKDVLQQVGCAYYESRAALMVMSNEGLTKTYNRFHDPDETSHDILRLRELHAAMDRAVLEAYGWHDIGEKAHCEFLLDYEDEEDEDDGRARKRKKPWRYRWPDEIRDEVLARLLALNVERAAEEELAGTGSPKAKKSVSGRKKSANTNQGKLL
jgi:hypothetical protein